MNYSLATSVAFLEDLSTNNTREWLKNNKDYYHKAKAEFEAFIEKLIEGINEFYSLDMLTAKDCVYRINRDVRFSNDKTPFNTHFSALLAPGGKKTKLVPLYIKIKPDGESILAAGVWEAKGELMQNIRQEIDYNPGPLQQWLFSEEFQTYFKKLEGDRLVRPPKGYSADHPTIELLKMKQFLVKHPISKEQYMADDFLPYSLNVLKAAMPLVEYFNVVLGEEEEVNIE